MNPKLTYAEILALVDAIDPTVYAKTRNHLSGAVTKLSPYITRGVISLPAIRDRVLSRFSVEQSEKFIQELAWREYFQKVFVAKEVSIFSDLRFPQAGVVHHELIESVITGNTGITAVDKEIQQLLEIGYMHNHARLWTAMIACNVGKAHWYTMSRFLYYHLLDGDLASNSLSWQWVAGTSSSKPYCANQDLINACSDTNDTGTFLSTPSEMIGRGEIPEVLKTHISFTYQMEYPISDPLPELSGQTVFLYHPFNIDPLWHASEEGVRICVIEPRLFDAHPVSLNVYRHFQTLMRTHIPNVHVYVGNIETLEALKNAPSIFSRSHPTTTHFPGVQEPVAELFPHVTGYYPSFFKFWQACQS